MARKTEKFTLYEEQPDAEGGTVKEERATFEIRQAGAEAALDGFHILARTVLPALRGVAPVLSQVLGQELEARKASAASEGATVLRPGMASAVLGKLFSNGSGELLGTLEGLLAAAEELLKSTSRQDLKDLRNLLLLSGTVHVVHREEGKKVRDELTFERYEDFFAGDVPGQLKLMAAALRVNYANFFTARGAKPQQPAAAGAPSQTSATSSTSPGRSSAS